MTTRTAKQISDSIATIAKNGKALDNLIQKIGMEVLAHIAEHPEASLACKLYKAMPNGSRKNALVAWMMEFGAIKVATGKNKEAVPLLWLADKETDLAGAEASPWFTFKPEKALDEEFDFDKQFASFLKKVQKAQAEGHLKAANDEKVQNILKLA